MNKMQFSMLMVYATYALHLVQPSWSWYVIIGFWAFRAGWHWDEQR